MSSILRFPLKILSIVLIRYLQRRYKKITIRHRYNQTNQILSKLRLIQWVLHYFKSQFEAWGYFHPTCVWTDKDEDYFRKIFPQKEDFEELTTVVWHNPAAVTYYHNKIFKLNGNRSTIYEGEIKKQLKKWNEWN